MGILTPPRRFEAGRPELMDDPGADPLLLEHDLRHLRMMNRWFGWLAAVRRHIGPMIDRTPSERPIRVLDLATGSGDHPLALVRYARTLGRSLQVVAVDAHPVAVDIARRHTRHEAAIEVRQADVLRLEEPDGSYDIVVCSLALHHFSRGEGIDLLRAMLRLSRLGFIVNDVHRSWPAAWGAWIWTHLTTRNPLTLHDAYVSVLRGFTPRELADMASEAGIERRAVHREPWFRLVLVGEH